METIILFAPLVGAILCGFGWKIMGETAAMWIATGLLFLSALLHEGIRLRQGAVDQSNFDDYPILTLDEAPEVRVVSIDGEDPIGGVGEPGYPPVGPAVLNALFDDLPNRLFGIHQGFLFQVADQFGQLAQPGLFPDHVQPVAFQQHHIVADRQLDAGAQQAVGPAAVAARQVEFT